MFEAVTRRARAAGERRVADATARIAGAIDGAIAGVSARAEPDRVVIEGRGVVRRWIADARLRWIAGWLK